MDYVQTIKTPVGDLKIEATAHQLTRVSILAEVNIRDKRNHITERCADRLEAYFKGHWSLSEEESPLLERLFSKRFGRFFLQFRTDGQFRMLGLHRKWEDPAQFELWPMQLVKIQ